MYGILQNILLVTSLGNNNLDGSLTLSQNATPLIPREALIRGFDRSQVNLSPDAKWIAFVGKLNGVSNVFVQEIDHENVKLIGLPRPVTFDKGRGIRGYVWTNVVDTLIVAQDFSGNEQYALFKVDVTGRRQQEALLPDISDARTMPQQLSTAFPDHIVVGVAKRNPVFQDPYLVNIVTGEKSLIFENNFFGNYFFDNNLQLRLARRETEKAEIEYMVPVCQDADLSKITGWKRYRLVGFDDSIMTRPAGQTFDISNKYIYWLESDGREFAALTICQFERPRNCRVIFEPQKADISRQLFHPIDKTPQMVAENYDMDKWHTLSESVKTDFEIISRVEKGKHSIGPISMGSKDMNTWLFSTTTSNSPHKYHLYSRLHRKVTYLFDFIDFEVKYPFSTMHSTDVTTRDGLTQLCYFMLPPWERSRVPSKPLPMVLDVHGGPWSRDRWWFNNIAQLFANRGYAVMMCQFRGSVGFGKSYVNAGDNEWAGKMRTDLLDGVNWAIQEGIADRDKIAIHGASFGGYAALVALTFTPDVFACGVAGVAPTDLKSFIDAIPPFFHSIYQMLIRRIGDPRTSQGRALLRQMSPLYKAHMVKKPLLMLQGANDPRVKRNESDRFVAALKRNDIPVTYVLFENEGHGLAMAENRFAYVALIENFLADCLGGRAQPMTDEMAKSTAIVIEQADFSNVLP